MQCRFDMSGIAKLLGYKNKRACPHHIMCVVANKKISAGARKHTHLQLYQVVRAYYFEVQNNSVRFKYIKIRRMYPKLMAQQ